MGTVAHEIGMPVLHIDTTLSIVCSSLSPDNPTLLSTAAFANLTF